MSSDTKEDQIRRLKEEKDAVILAHYYVNDEVQKIADYIGDSFYLSKAATKIKHSRIVFAGVSFMGESAKILNPEKKVLLPDMTADCAMARMVSAADIEKIRKEIPDITVVCYINSTAEVKACSDVCVTSSNAVKIVKKLESNNIYFVPDGNLGRYVAQQVPEKNIILHRGFCPVHNDITAKLILSAKEIHPMAKVLVHPECEKEVCDVADYIGSTAEIIDYATASEDKEFIIGTEEGVLFELRKRNPDKKFFLPTDVLRCGSMKKITLDNIIDVLENDGNEVYVDEDMRQRALKPLERMLELAK